MPLTFPTITCSRAGPLLLLLAGLSASTASCDRAAPNGLDAQKFQPPETHAPLTIGPMDYFERACAGCHGPRGMFFEEDLRRQLDDAALARAVEEMVTQRATTQVSGRELKALIAYNRALLDGSPMLAWTAGPPGATSGEATPGADLEATAEGRTIAITMDGHRWSIAAPPRDLRIVARLGGRERTLLIPSEAFTDHSPDPQDDAADAD